LPLYYLAYFEHIKRIIGREFSFKIEKNLVILLMSLTS